MKILQINVVYKEKSTGRTCLEVKRALEARGHEAYVAFGKGKHKDENTYRIGSDIEYYIHNIMARITGFQGYFSYFATRRLITYIGKTAPDIIHLRNLHANYLNLPLLFKYLEGANIPVILNLHDCWAFTGKCAYFTDKQCFKWKTGCSDCPTKKSYPQSWFFDRTSKQYNDKKKWFANIEDLTVVGVSEWTTNQAKMSFLSNREVLTIYNWIDRNVFYPRKENILEQYGVDSTKFIILGVSASWIPGSPRYDDFIMVSDLVGDNMQIVLVGQTTVRQFPNNVKHIPFISDTEELAKLYSSADVYVHLSTEDTFGKVVAEAMACGTPAVVYNSTALPELIEDGCGYIVEPRDINSIMRSITEVMHLGKAYYSDNCIANVAKNFDFSKNTAKLISLYERIAHI